GSGSEVQLPPSTSSVAAWSAALQSVAASGALQDEVEFWAETVAPDAGLAASRQGGRALRLRPPGLTPDAGPNVEGNVRVVELALSVEETRDLLQRVPAAYGTRVDDALVAALSATLAEWLGAGSLVVDLEGHGR